MDENATSRPVGFDDLVNERDQSFLERILYHQYTSASPDTSSAHRAADFDPRPGARPREDSAPIRNSETRSTIPPTPADPKHPLGDLRNPSEALVTDILQVVKSDKYTKDVDSDDAKAVISSILKSCFFFNVTDLSHIAYIFATIAHESKFGSEPTERGDVWHISKYEPVFKEGQEIAELPQEKNKPKTTLHTRLNDGRVILANTITTLMEVIENKAIPDAQFVTLQKKVLEYITFYNLRLEEEFSGLLQRLKERNKNIFMEICEKFLNVVLQSIEDPITLSYLTTKELDEFARRMNVPEKQRKSDMQKIITEEQKRVYRIKLLPRIIEKLVQRIETSKNLGNNSRGDGEKFKGRGLVQLTGRYLYTHYSKLIAKEQKAYFQSLSWMGLKFKEEEKRSLPTILVDNPPLLAENTLIGAVVTVGGMSKDGFRTPKKVLSSYGSGNSFKFFNARDIVNKDKEDLLPKEKIMIGTKIENSAKNFLTALQKRR